MFARANVFKSSSMMKSNEELGKLEAHLTGYYLFDSKEVIMKPVKRFL